MDPALRELLERTVALEASDLHLRSGAVPKVRRSGSLEALPGEPLGAEQRALMLRLIGDRAEIRRRAAQASLELLRRTLSRES